MDDLPIFYTLIVILSVVCLPVMSDEKYYHRLIYEIDPCKNNLSRLEPHQFIGSDIVMDRANKTAYKCSDDNSNELIFKNDNRTYASYWLIPYSSCFEFTVNETVSFLKLRAYIDAEVTIKKRKKVQYCLVPHNILILNQLETVIGSLAGHDILFDRNFTIPKGTKQVSFL